MSVPRRGQTKSKEWAVKSVRTILLGGLLVLTGCGSEPPPQQGVFIQYATLIDGTGAAPQASASIWIRGNQIEAIGTDLEPVVRQNSSAREIIDLRAVHAAAENGGHRRRSPARSFAARARLRSN